MFALRSLIGISLTFSVPSNLDSSLHQRFQSVTVYVALVESLGVRWDGILYSTFPSSSPFRLAPISAILNGKQSAKAPRECSDLALSSSHRYPSRCLLALVFSFLVLSSKRQVQNKHRNEPTGNQAVYECGRVWPDERGARQVKVVWIDSCVMLVQHWEVHAWRCTLVLVLEAGSSLGCTEGTGFELLNYRH